MVFLEHKPKAFVIFSVVPGHVVPQKSFLCVHFIGVHVFTEISKSIFIAFKDFFKKADSEFPCETNRRSCS